MRWTRTDNPRVWEASDGRHYAMAEDTTYGGGGYTGRVYARPVQFSFLEARPKHVGLARWGADPEAALRRVIKGFDPEAELPKRERVLP